MAPKWKQIEIRGRLFKVHLDELFSNAIVRDGDFYEADILDYIRDNYPKQGIIIDAGANIGNHTVYFSRYLTYHRIYAFEPAYDNYVLLMNNTFDIPSVTILNSALGAENKDVPISLNTSNFGAHEIRDVGDYEVSMYTLDHFRFMDVTLLKIDVEWYEPKVIEGAKNTIQRCKPLILIEDVNQEYGPLLPDYELIKAWDHHRTYLYGWKND